MNVVIQKPNGSWHLIVGSCQIRTPFLETQDREFHTLSELIFHTLAAGQISAFRAEDLCPRLATKFLTPEKRTSGAAYSDLIHRIAIDAHLALGPKQLEQHLDVLMRRLAG